MFYLINKYGQMFQEIEDTYIYSPWDLQNIYLVV